MVCAPRAAHVGPLMLTVAAEKQRGAFALRVHFELPTPGVVALFGRSGCGKSSLVNIIAGLLAPDAGSIALDDFVLLDTDRGINVPPERRRIGYVFQDARLFPHLSVAANLRYAQKRAVGAPYVSLDAVTGLLDLASLMDRRTHQLSGGERQRVAIGRALLTQPRLLLLDEPLAALDGARREEVLPYLGTLRDQLAIPMVYVTHDFDDVLRLATHIVLMEAGSVIAQGAVGEMSLDPHLRAIIGPDEVGAIIDGLVLGIDSGANLTKVRVGDGELYVQTMGLAAGTALRVQLLARDIIVSTQIPQHMSVRNSLAGVVTSIHGDDLDSDLVTIDIGAAQIMARITKAATRDLSLRPGMKVWALVKSVSLRGHSFAAPTPDGFKAATSAASRDA
jgi:molybdate transport system ATP-binding protein